MAIQLSTSEQSVGYVEWNCGSSNLISYTRLYVRYAMESSTTARVYVRQVVATRDSGLSWSGTNNYYRTRCDGKYDSGYTKYASGWGRSETQVWSGSFTCTTSGWESLQCYFATFGGTYYGETWTDVFVPESAFATPPTGLSVSVKELLPTGAKFDVKVTGWGNGGSSADRYFEAALMNHGGGYGSPYCYTHGTHGISANVTETLEVSTAHHHEDSSITTISPNTQYNYGAWCTNGSLAESVMPGTVVTLAPAATVSTSTIGETTIKINYSTSADGGKYTKNIQYSIDNGSTWTTGATVSSSSASSGTFSINGLEPGTSYTVKVRVSTDAGITNGSDINVTTLEAYKIYGSVSGKTKKIKKLYCSVSGKTKKIKKLYGSVGGKTKRIF